MEKPVEISGEKQRCGNRTFALLRLKIGRWQKVIKKGNTGEVHYFEHESGSVADVKFFPIR